MRGDTDATGLAGGHYTPRDFVTAEVKERQTKVRVEVYARVHVNCREEGEK